MEVNTMRRAFGFCALFGLVLYGYASSDEEVESPAGPEPAEKIHVFAALMKLRRACCNVVLAGSPAEMPSAKLEAFADLLGEVRGGSELFRKVWGESEESGDEQLFLYISYLRQKLGAIQADLLIEGERGGSFVLRQRDA